MSRTERQPGNAWRFGLRIILGLGIAVWCTLTTLPYVQGQTTVPNGDPPTVIATIPLGEPFGAGTFAIAVNPRTNTIYATNPGALSSPVGLDCDSHDVSVIHGSTNTVLSPISVGLNPFGVAVNPTTNRIYVANAGGAGFDSCSSEPSYSVSVIDGITNSVVNTLTVGLGPGFVAVNPKTNKIYVTLTGGCCADGHAVDRLRDVRYNAGDDACFIVGRHDDGDGLAHKRLDAISPIHDTIFSAIRFHS